MAAPTSGQAAAQQNGTAKTGGRKRHVASAAGAARYHKPIGSEIGQARDANHAAIQQDRGARKNYGDLVGGDQAKQRQALDGMSTDDLNKLADIAFSFKSADPKVVQLRIAARNAQARRGIRVPVGQTQTYLKGKPPAPAPGNRSNRGAAKALSRVGPASTRLIELAQAAEQKNVSKFGNFPIPDVAHLRKAVQAIGRAKPEHRPIIARHILARAKALNASHLVSDHIKHYALGHRQPGTVGMSRAEQRAIELAGRWKHGYIPLDAEALASKMKGGKGKPWWEGGHGHSVGGSAKKDKPSGSPKSGSPKVSNSPAIHKPAGSPAEKEARQRAYLAISRTPEYQRAAQIASSRAYPKGFEKTSRNRRDEISRTGASNPTREDVLAAAAQLKREREIFGGKTRQEAYRERFDNTKKTHLEIEQELKAIETKHLLAERKSGTVRKGTSSRPLGIDAHGNKLPDKPKTPSTPTIKDPKRGTSDKAMTNPSTLAKNYVQMHGSEAARRKADQLENKARPSARDRALAGALKAWAGGGGGSGTNKPQLSASKVTAVSGKGAGAVPSGRGSATAKLTPTMKATLAKSAAHPKGYVSSTSKTGNEIPGLSARGLIEYVPKGEDPEAYRLGEMRLTAKGRAAAKGA